MVIADSSIWIAFQRIPGSEVAAELHRLLAEDEVAMVGPVLTEVLQGARSEAEFGYFASRLTTLSFLEVDQETWVGAAKLNYGLRQRGQMLAVGDLIISALALRHDVPVYSLNGDFDRVDGLRRHKAAAC